MNGEIDNNDVDDNDINENVQAEQDEDTVVEEILDEDIEVDIDDDNIGDLSVEINVEELVAKIESTDGDDIDQKRDVRKKLDKIRDQKDDEVEGTYNFNLDDDI